MRIIVTHHSPDLDAITSVWLIRRFLSGWEEARVRFVPAGERIQRLVNKGIAYSSKKQLNAKRLARQGASYAYTLDAIEKIGDDEIIHVDTGLGPLDHHQITSDEVSAASLTLDFVQRGVSKDKIEALRRMVKVVVDIDHFKEALLPQAAADYHEFSLHGILEGLREKYPNKEGRRIDFIIKCLDSLLHNFENRIWAEKEIKKGMGFRVKGEEAIGFETINDTVLPLAQKMGYVIVVRKDPRKGYVRIKVRPDSDIDLTPAYQKLKKMDSQATWFLHVSKKMLLNGTTKNPRMKPTRLTLKEIIEVLKNI